jgi:CubicO group peptidase (beta-lactamase class C family)
LKRPSVLAATLLASLLSPACEPAADSADPGDTGPADSAEPSDTADSAAPSLYDADAIEAIEKAVRQDLRASIASGVQIAVWHDGAIVYTFQDGSSHPDQDVPIGTSTLFQVGSDTKKMTALVALQQVERGALSLDTPVSLVLPAVALAASPTWSDAATLHDLLSHQGGLFDYTPWHDDPDDAQLRGVAEGIFSEKEWAMNEPGAFWNYSNPNFSIAGLMAEAAGGEPWADLVTHELFEPLGLSDTFARKEAVVERGDYATGWGYTIDDPDPWNLLDSPAYTQGTVEMDEVVDNAFTRPTGMVWSTASDMARFHAFFIEGDPAVLDDALRAETTTMQTRFYPAWDEQGYGYGWMVVDGIRLPEFYDIPVWVHGGNTLSFTSTSYVLPEQSLSISILSNGYGDDFTRTVIALIEGSGLLPAAVADPGYPGDETDPERLVGTYTDRTLGRFVVGWDGAALTVEMPDADEMGLSHGDQLEFAGLTDVYTIDINRSAVPFVFTADSAGAYRWLADRQFVGVRDGGEANARPRPPGPPRFDPRRLGPDPRAMRLLAP